MHGENLKLCDTKITVCWQDWRDITQEIAVTVNKGCHDWTEEAAPWISQQLGLLVLHIACVVLCVALS